MTDDITAAAAALGRKGGKSKSPAKLAALAENRKRSGRKTLRELAERRVDATPELQAHKDFIMADLPEGIAQRRWAVNAFWRWVLTAPVAEIVEWAEAAE